MDNNKQSSVRFYGLAIVLISVFLSSAVQAQYSAEPTDFDRLLSGEFNAISPPFVTGSDCNATGSADTFGCSGVLYLRLTPTISGNQLVVRMEARAGQEAIGTLKEADECTRADGSVVNVDATTCGFFPGSSFRAGPSGNANLANPANILYGSLVQFTYSKDIFVGNPETPGFPDTCVGSTEYGALVTSPAFAASSIDNGVGAYSYDAANQATEPGELTPAQRIQYPTDDYAEVVTITCDLPTSASNKLLGMSYHLNVYGNLAFAHHVDGTNSADGDNNNAGNNGESYATSAENSLEFFPLDGSNYIAHAEITEDGKGVLIEYAQAVTDNTNESYLIVTSGGSEVVPTSPLWLNDKTVWLTVGGTNGIYGSVARSTTPLSADRHVLVSSLLSGDASFGSNFGRASTYRAVLTQHMSVADYAGTAPTITGITVGPGTESIAVTFSEAVCHKTETGCDALTADSFDVKLYKGVISSTAEPIQPSISSFDLTGNVATLTFGSIGTLDGTERLLVRTARNSRFSDTFISDRTIFSQANQQIGMLHLQAGALAQAIPTIRYALTAHGPDGLLDTADDILAAPDGSTVYSADELNTAAQGTTSTFTITRTPPNYSTGSNTVVTIMRTSNSNPASPATPDPDNFVVKIDGTTIDASGSDADEWESEVTFAIGEDTKEIEIQHTGDTRLNDDYVYTIAISPAAIPGGGSQQITYTIADDEDDIPPTLPGNRAITYDAGATQVTLSFDAAYDRVGSISDPSNASFTRDVDYEFTFSRSGTSQEQVITMRADALMVPFDEANSVPNPVPVVSIDNVEINRQSMDDAGNNIIFLPGNSYRVEISVTDRARNSNTDDSYSVTFTMETDVGNELAGVSCGGTDPDMDGVASAYELSIGTDCTSSGGDGYIGTNPPPASLDAVITFTPADTIVREAGATTYTAIDAGAMCAGADCNNLKAFIVSTGIATADAVSMVTEICSNDTSPGSTSCWVDDISVVNGTVMTQIPLQLGFNVINWVAADMSGNLILSSRATQTVYVAPTVILNGITDLVRPSGVASVSGTFMVQFAQQGGGDSISFIGETMATMVPALSFNCTPATSFSAAPTATTSLYSYTATDAGTCTFPGLMTTSVITFGDIASVNEFYFAGNQISVTLADDENNPVASSTMRETAPDANDNPDAHPMDSNGDPIENQLLTTMTQSAIEVPIDYEVRLSSIANTYGHDFSNLDQGALATTLREDIGVPDDTYNGEGVFEFRVYLPPNVNTAYAAIPLAVSLNEDKAYYKYINNQWRRFERDSNNEYWSAPGTVDPADGSVTCPPPVPSGVWGEPGILSADDQCVLLKMIETGNNDADDRLNGVIFDPGAPGRLTGGGGSSGGSGATDFWFLAALLGLVALPPMIRRYRLRRQ